MIRLTKEHPQQNVSRFYLPQVESGLFGNWAVVREWGRIGQPGTVRKDWYDTREEAQRAAHIVLRTKQKRGYTAFPLESVQYYNINIVSV